MKCTDMGWVKHTCTLTLTSKAFLRGTFLNPPKSFKNRENLKDMRIWEALGRLGLNLKFRMSMDQNTYTNYKKFHYPSINNIFIFLMAFSKLQRPVGQTLLHFAVEIHVT